MTNKIRICVFYNRCISLDAPHVRAFGFIRNRWIHSNRGYRANENIYYVLPMFKIHQFLK